MSAFLIDADAFLAMRSLSLLGLLRQSPMLEQAPIIMTSYIAQFELSSLATLVQELAAHGVLRIESARTGAARQRFRQLHLRPGVDKGEAEAIAWILGLDEDKRPLFFSCDQRARNTALQEGVPTGDLMDFVVACVEEEFFSRDEAQEHLQFWDDPSQQLGRPRDFTDFDDTYQRRAEQRR